VSYALLRREGGPFKEMPFAFPTEVDLLLGGGGAKLDRADNGFERDGGVGSASERALTRAGGAGGAPPSKGGILRAGGAGVAREGEDPALEGLGGGGGGAGRPGVVGGVGTFRAGETAVLLRGGMAGTGRDVDNGEARGGSTLRVGTFGKGRAGEGRVGGAGGGETLRIGGGPLLGGTGAVVGGCGAVCGKPGTTRPGGAGTVKEGLKAEAVLSGILGAEGLGEGASRRGMVGGFAREGGFTG
jgi:hypothetical protein